MRVSLAGLPFDISPEDELRPAERWWLDRLDAGGKGEAQTIQFVPEPPWTSTDASLYPSDRPARVVCHETAVRLSHFQFTAEVFPEERLARLYRKERDIDGLRVTLKTALACRLPLDGGLPLHAAGVVLPCGQAVILFGPSGAGKSTIADRSPYPVLSDELIAVMNDAGTLTASATGFWGSLDRESAPRGRYPVAAAFRLEQGDGLEFQPLTEGEGMRRLLGVVLVPLSATLWPAALSQVRRFSEAVPMYRLSWSLEDSPWDAIETIVATTPRPGNPHTFSAPAISR